MGVLRGSGASSLTAGGWLLPVAGALLLSGCIPGAFIRPDSDSCPCAASTAANSGASTDQPKSEQAPEKSNKPRTLPQAVCAYLHCLRTHGWEAQDQKENEESANEKKGNKSPTKGQKPDEGSEATPKKEKDEEDASKNPPNGQKPRDRSEGTP